MPPGAPFPGQPGLSNAVVEVGAPAAVVVRQPLELEHHLAGEGVDDEGRPRRLAAALAVGEERHRLAEPRRAVVDVDDELDLLVAEDEVGGAAKARAHAVLHGGERVGAAHRGLQLVEARGEIAHRTPVQAAHAPGRVAADDDLLAPHGHPAQLLAVARDRAAAAVVVGAHRLQALGGRQAQRGAKGGIGGVAAAGAQPLQRLRILAQVVRLCRQRHGRRGGQQNRCENATERQCCHGPLLRRLSPDPPLIPLTCRRQV